MKDSRLKVLARIGRQIRAGVAPPGAAVEHPGSLPLSPGDADRASAIARFTREYEALTGTVHRARDEAAAVAVTLDLLRSLGAGRVLAWDDQRLGVPALGPALREAGVVVESCWLPPASEERAARLQALDAVPVGLTGALAGVADTGSLVVVSGPGQGRIASLLPPVHVAVLHASSILPSLAHVFAAYPNAIEEGSNLVVITGPSRTADIEMTLTRGVHGPGEVHAVIVGD